MINYSLPFFFRVLFKLQLQLFLKCRGYEMGFVPEYAKVIEQVSYAFLKVNYTHEN